ncbi:sulfotransferase [Hyunsoonleella sp. SJ7]|uniref:Sulfotransferase n=1 Tax=Hyunsoonleella aquatilis TaxID=2762758 RepID=A0A923H7V8_9FLAO|nr:sulfotransferase [Hyunsoonleella aquatilis]MBC3757750.1 sulfotransferase [Hyunsoonleella aquatilis]
MADMYQNKDRTPYFKKDDSLEEALLDLNRLIGGIQPKNNYFSDKRPIILIIGCPRSGSTVMLQWLASLGLFSYPSNLIARFYKNPYIGIRVQQSILEFDPLNQMGFHQTEINFKSSLGKTMGALSPSEFWYYWYEYFKFGENTQKLSKSQLKKVDGERFLKELYAFEYLTGKPLVMKGMLLNWNIPYLYQLNSNFLFINLTREPTLNAQSLLLAREKFFNNRNKWYSFKPQEYSTLKHEDPITQVAGQVVYTQNAVDVGLSELPKKNVLHVQYEDFCSNPAVFLHNLIRKYNDLSGEGKLNCDTVSFTENRFVANTEIRLSNADMHQLEKKIEFFRNKLAQES